jgi:hypothetical protein
VFRPGRLNPATPFVAQRVSVPALLISVYCFTSGYQKAVFAVLPDAREEG